MQGHHAASDILPRKRIEFLYGRQAGMRRARDTMIQVAPRKDVTFSACPVSIRAQKLDLALPQDDRPFPLVILVHGGSFKFGDKQKSAGGRCTGL